MAKLKNLKPLVGRIAPLIRNQSGDERQRSRFRDDTQHWRAWYKTARWQKLRWSVLVRDLFTCQMCKRVDTSKYGLHCDHIEPHRGDEAKFWSGPFQTLCADCHNSAKARMERSGSSRA